ncbi:WbqC-like family protein [Vibrio phage vB_VneS_J26]
MAQITTTILTTCPTPSVYDLARMMLCDRTIVLEQIPLVYNANVNALHLPSCTNKQLFVPIADPTNKLMIDLSVVNLDGFFRNLRGMFLTGYASAPNLDLLLDYLETWQELCATKRTLAEVNLASLHALKLVFGLPTCDIETDIQLTGRNTEDAVTYAKILTAHFMGDLFVYRSGHTSINEMVIVSEARISGEAMRYQMVDQDLPGIDELPQQIDVKNTSCLEVLAWLPKEKHGDFFKATLYGN